MAANETKDSKGVVEKLKELEASLAKELDQKVRLSEPSDPRLEGTVDVNPNMAQALQKAKDQAQAASFEEKRAVAAAAASDGAAPAAKETTPPKAATSIPASPTLVPPAADPKRGHQEPDVDNMTMKDVDELLSGLDANFQTSMEEIKSEIGKVETLPALESISIGTDFLKDAEVKEVGPENPEALLSSDDMEGLAEGDIKEWARNATLRQILARFFAATYRLPLRGVAVTIKEAKLLRSHPANELFMEIARVLKSDGRHWLELAKALVQRLRSYSRRTYFIFGLIVVSLLSILFLARDIVTNFHGDMEKDPFLRNLFGVADSVQAIPGEDDGEDLESPLRHPEYTILVHRLVANLKAPTPDDTPMVVMELYIEASNQETAIEIHNRESEVRDILARVMEQTTFDEIDTPQGKARVKIRIRNGLDRILNKGTAKHIYFKNLNFTE